MEFFQRAKVFRLKRSGQSKYLITHKDEETIKQSHDKFSNNARWTYELVVGKPKLIRLRSCCSWRYLAATEDPFLLGMTGKKVVQTITQGPAIEWEPIKEGSYIKLKSHTGSFLRANRGPPPWRNSVTHDEPGHWTGTENMTLWIVDILEIDYQSSRMGNGDCTSTEEVKGIDTASFSSNLASQEVSCPAYLSPMSSFDQNEAAVSSSLKHSANVSSTNGAKSSILSEYPVQSASEHVEPLEVKRAKQTFEQLKNAEFRTILSLGQDKKLEKAVDVLIADAKSIGRGKIPSKLVNIQEQLKSMKNDHESASQILVEHSTFSTKRLEIRDELKKDVAKARELQDLEVNVNNTIVDARGKREALLKQLEETENAIRKVEKAQSDSMVEIEELILRKEQNSKGLEEMESKEKSWRVRKNEAERLLERVEKDWEKRAKVFRLKCSHHNKYLVADEDEERVRQSRDKSSSRARWVYELVEGKENVIRIRSGWSYRYLTASDDPFLLGMTGKKVLQTISHGPIIEWEPIKEGPYIKLKSHKGSYLRANPRMPPWRNTVTHDEPGNWAVTDNMILWIVDIVEIDYQFSGVADDCSIEDSRESNVSSMSSEIGDHKSTYSGFEDELDDTKGTGANSAKSNSEHIHQVEVEMAKKTLKELKDLDFHTILTSQRGEKLERVVKVFIADAKSQGRIPGDLINLLGQLKVMQNEHVSASQDLIKYARFSTRKSEIMAELQRDAAQARELETFQDELQTARNAKEELVKQLEEVENIIMDLEKAQADNSADAEELISRMGQKSQKLEEMKKEERTWQVRRTEASRMLERVEEDWVKIKTMFLAD